MPLTLADAKQLSQDKLTDMIIDEFTESPLLADLTFDNNVKAQGGKSMTYSYNRITTQPTAGSRAVNGEYTSQETKTTRQTVDLKIIGGAYEIDRVIANNEKQVVDEVEFQAKQKAKATVAEIHDQIINGDVSKKATDFDGLNKILTGTTSEIKPTTPIDISTATKAKENSAELLHMLRKAIGKMDGDPTHILMNRDMFVSFQSAVDNAHGLSVMRDEMGRETFKFGTAKIVQMGSKPGGNSPIIETTSAGETSIYVVRVGMDGFHGVSPEGNELVKSYLPDFSTPGAVKKGEVEAVIATVLKTTSAAAVLRKVKIA